MIAPYARDKVDINDPVKYSSPAFTEADAWNMDTTLATYLACGLNAYLNDAEKCGQMDNNEGRTIRAHIVTFAEWSLLGSGFGQYDESLNGRLDQALVWLSVNFRRLWT